MLFDKGKINKAIAKQWKYSGICKDKKGRKWAFYTNSPIQFKTFRKKRERFGLIFVEGYENINYGVIKRLLER